MRNGDSISSLLLVGTFASLLFPVAAAAKTIPWIGGIIGYSGYTMNELNDSIDEVNSLVYPYEMEELNGGALYGFQFGMSTSPSAKFYLGYERLTGTSDIADYSGKIEVRIPANCFYAGAEYEFPAKNSFKLGIGACGGLVSAAGGAEFAITGEGGEAVDYEGTAPMGTGYLFGAIPIAASQVWLVPQFGYRVSNISDPEIDGGEAPFDLDYSGIIAKLAFRVNLTK